MKKLILSIAAIFAVAVATAEEPIFKKGNIAVNFGVGAVKGYVPFEAAVDFGLVDNAFEAEGLTFGVGLYGSYAQEAGIDLMAFGVRAPFNYTVTKGVDLYSAPMIYTAKMTNVGNVGLRFGWRVAGARVMIAENFGVYAEAGFGGLTDLSAGLTLKF